MEKKFKNGLCLGKFMPIHNGHIHMIIEASKLCDMVHVMVCSRLCEPIDGDKRFKWVELIFKDNPNINVIHCIDENPQYPEDDENFWKIWHDSVYEHISELDAVFASEDYVFPFAKCLKVEPVLVDKNRLTVPVSGTDIRRNPFNNWMHIPDVVKNDYRFKIAIVGPESSGKTTLTTQLANHYNGIMVEEYGREYTETKIAKSLLPDDFYHIAYTHNNNILNAEKLAFDKDSKYIFTDTEAIVTRTFLEMYAELHGWYTTNRFHDVSYYMNKIDEMIKLQMFGDSIKNRKLGKIDLYILTYPDLDWEDDRTRDFEDKKIRLNSFLRIKHQLDINNCKYHILMGKGQVRFDKAIKIIEEVQKEIWEKSWHKLSFEK